MGDRFYQQQLDRLGVCPGYYGKPKRRKNMSWTDELKDQVVSEYVAADPTPETSMDIVKEIADGMGQSPNGVRMILSKAGVYVKKAPAPAAAKSSGSTGGSRVSKAAATEALINALTDSGQEIDMEIITKLTGKAAVYFTGIVENMNS